MNKVIVTGDGSHTIFVPGLNEHYHSVHGAIQESEHIFIRNGYRAILTDRIRIFEVGFGTGLNCILTAVECSKDKKDIFYTSVEKYPLELQLLESLNHGSFFGREHEELIRKIYRAPWETVAEISGNFHLRKLEMDLVNDPLTGEYDIVYFDAFGPGKQPEMWTEDIFSRIAEIIVPGGLFVTYSAKGEVRRNLKKSGFLVERLAGPPGKREMIRASKI